MLKEKSVGRMVESIVGCKWSMRVLKLLSAGINRPGEMQRQVEGLTTKVLNERLNKLMRFNIIHKEVFPVSPPHVEYHLTDFGKKFMTLIDAVDTLQDELDASSD